MLSMNANSSFLAKGLHVYLVLAVVATTLLQWFLVNSLLILLLTGCRLWDGRAPLAALRKAFSDPLFLAFFAIFLLDVSGFLHTHDPQLVWMHVQRKATLIAIPFVVSAGPFADGAGFRKLLWSYCWLLAGLSCWCLAVAMIRSSSNRSTCVEARPRISGKRKGNDHDRRRPIPHQVGL